MLYCWHAPFSSGDPKVIEKGLEGTETALRSAKAQGAETVLLVPAVLNEKAISGRICLKETPTGSRFALRLKRSAITDS